MCIKCNLKSLTSPRSIDANQIYRKNNDLCRRFFSLIVSSLKMHIQVHLKWQLNHCLVGTVHLVLNSVYTRQKKQQQQRFENALKAMKCISYTRGLKVLIADKIEVLHLER